MGLKGFQEHLMAEYKKGDDTGEMPDIDSWVYDDVRQGYERPKPKCTCGVKFTGGLHSDWCLRGGSIQGEPDE